MLSGSASESKGADSRNGGGNTPLCSWAPSSALQAHLTPSDSRLTKFATSVQSSHIFIGPANPSHHAHWQWCSLNSHLQINLLAGKLWLYSWLHPPNTYYTYKWFLNKPVPFCILTDSTIRWKLRAKCDNNLLFSFVKQLSSTNMKLCCRDSCVNETGLLLQLRAELPGKARPMSEKDKTR